MQDAPTMLGGDDIQYTDIHDRLEMLERDNQDNIQHQNVSRAIRIAALMHYRAISRRIPHRQDPSNVADSVTLWMILRKSHMSEWSHMPYVYYWV